MILSEAFRALNRVHEICGNVVLYLYIYTTYTYVYRKRNVYMCASDAIEERLLVIYINKLSAVIKEKATVSYVINLEFT